MLHFNNIVTTKLQNKKNKRYQTNNRYAQAIQLNIAQKILFLLSQCSKENKKTCLTVNPLGNLSLNFKSRFKNSIAIQERQAYEGHIIQFRYKVFN